MKLLHKFTLTFLAFLSLPSFSFASGFPLIYEKAFGQYGNITVHSDVRVNGIVRCPFLKVKKNASGSGTMQFTLTEYTYPHATIVNLEQIPYPASGAKVEFYLPKMDLLFRFSIKGIGYAVKSNIAGTNTLYSGDDLQYLAHVGGRAKVIYPLSKITSIRGTVYAQSTDKTCTFNGRYSGKSVKI